MFYDERFSNVEIGECDQCGEKFRFSFRTRRVRSYEKEWRDNNCKGPLGIYIYVYESNCGKPACLNQLKQERELQYKHDALKLRKKALDKELKQLRKAIKGE